LVITNSAYSLPQIIHVTVTQSEVIKALRFLLFIFPFHFLLSVRAQLLNASIGSLWWHLFALEYYCEYTISTWTFWLVYWTWTWLFLGLLIDLVDTLRAKQSSIWCAKDMCVPDRPSRFSLCICFRRSSEYVSFGDVQVLVQCILYLQHNSRRPWSCPTNRDIEWRTVGDVCVNDGMFHCTLYLRFIVLFYSSIFWALGAFCQLQRIVSGDTGNV
jgi:hypothetical protein